MEQDYKQLFLQQKLLNQKNEQKIQDLELKQRSIENSYRSLRQLRQELTTLNQEAQFNNEKIHSFLAAFLPDYRLIKDRPPPTTRQPPPVQPVKPQKKIEEPKVQINFKVQTGEGLPKLPIPSVSYQWSDSKSKVYMPRYTSRYGNLANNEELQLTLKFETCSSDLPAKLHLELCDQEGNVVFKKRQNIYYVKLQEKLVTLDSDTDYTLKITAIQDDIKTDEEVVIQSKQACDGNIQVAKPVKSKEIIVHQAKIEELPRVSFKEVTFSIEPMTIDNADKCCISTVPAQAFEQAKRTKKPVVLFNKDEPVKSVTAAPNLIVFEQKKILPDVALYRWHKGFRHLSGRYTRVTVLKMEIYYPDDLHDILVSRYLSLALTASSNHTWHTKGRVRDHKCFVEFVIFEEDIGTAQFDIKVSSAFDVSDLQDFQFNVGQIEVNKWKQHEFNK